MSSPVSSRRARGRQGEALAEQFLRRAGFRILARNVHLRHSELDLVALEGSTLCFVEVRLRSSGAFGSAEELARPASSGACCAGRASSSLASACRATRESASM